MPQFFWTPAAGGVSGRGAHATSTPSRNFGSTEIGRLMMATFKQPNTACQSGLCLLFVQARSSDRFAGETAQGWVFEKVSQRATEPDS